MDLAVLHWVAMRAVFRPVEHEHVHNGDDIRQVALFATTYLRAQVGELDPVRVPEHLQYCWAGLAHQYAKRLCANKGCPAF